MIIDNAQVTKPDHYALEGMDGYEAIDVIKAVLGDRFGAFCRGNALKYLIRADKKNGIEDLQKAMKYLEWEVEACQHQS